MTDPLMQPVTVVTSQPAPSGGGYQAVATSAALGTGILHIAIGLICIIINSWITGMTGGEFKAIVGMFGIGIWCGFVVSVYILDMLDGQISQENTGDNTSMSIQN